MAVQRWDEEEEGGKETNSGLVRGQTVAFCSLQPSGFCDMKQRRNCLLLVRLQQLAKRSDRRESC